MDTFDSQFGLTASGPTLYQQYGAASSFLTVLDQNGQHHSLPSTDPSGPATGNWEVEEALDVEWVHAIAPGAQIILVEANSQSLSDLMSSVATAASQPGRVGGVDELGLRRRPDRSSPGRGALRSGPDHSGRPPGRHLRGQHGRLRHGRPRIPRLLAQRGGGRRHVAVSQRGQFLQQRDGLGFLRQRRRAQFIGSGGGVSQFEAEPTYQLGVQSTGYRTTPDVSFVADPTTGAWIADPYNLTADNPFEVVGGTSLSAPSWAGLIALANQGRAAAGEATLGSASDPTATQEALYSLPPSDFNSVTTGSNGYNAAAGYNLVTGLGTPQANLLIPDLISYSGPINFAANAGNATVTAATLAEYTSGTFFGGTANAFQESDALLVHFAGRGRGDGGVRRLHGCDGRQPFDNADRRRNGSGCGPRGAWNPGCRPGFQPGSRFRC